VLRSKERKIVFNMINFIENKILKTSKGWILDEVVHTTGISKTQVLKFNVEDASSPSVSLK
jgi:hypothetical protein